MSRASKTCHPCVIMSVNDRRHCDRCYQSVASLAVDKHCSKLPSRAGSEQHAFAVYVTLKQSLDPHYRAVECSRSAPGSPWARLLQKDHLVHHHGYMH